MNVRDSEEVVKEIEALYFKWLEYSGYRNEKEMLEILIQKGVFAVRVSEDEKGIEIGFMNEHILTPLGVSICFERGDRESFLNLQLLLLFIANKLDDVNRSLAPFMQHQECCYDIAKCFLLDNSSVLWEKG